jgi:hypothetical protein
MGGYFLLMYGDISATARFYFRRCLVCLDDDDDRRLWCEFCCVCALFCFATHFHAEYNTKVIPTLSR